MILMTRDGSSGDNIERLGRFSLRGWGGSALEAGVKYMLQLLQTFYACYG
ncbi:hypothetical protein Hanom_Chr04g00333921 [Helianthus anomalus]